MFNFEPAEFVTYKNKKILEKCRALSGEALTKHTNPDFKIHIVQNPGGIWIADMVARIQRSDILDEKCVMILPNPCVGAYTAVAETINRLRINCRNLYVFTMDEWADDAGNIAPESYRAGFSYSNRKYLIGKINPELRPPGKNIIYPNNQNFRDYSKLLEEAGNADICYSGPGWAGHIAFIDPLTPEFSCKSMDEFINMGSRVVTLNPMTIMQNSLHGVFGQSGDIANVPPKAATIGPLDVKRAKNRFEIHDLTTCGGFSSWQRMISRLVLHGEVTTLVPASILQLWKTDVYISETIAAPIECMETVGY